MRKFIRANKLILWQCLFMLSGAFWLFAPLLDTVTSSRSTLISEYEIMTRPYSWLFRLCDMLAALLFLFAIIYLQNKQVRWGFKKTITLIIIGILMFVDPIFTLNCSGGLIKCLSMAGISFYIHGFESVLLGIILFILSAHDAIKRKLAPSILFALFQILYGLVGIVGVSSSYKLNTLTQFVYQFLIIIWLGWFVGSYVNPHNNRLLKHKTLVRRTFATWAYLNGAAAIFISVWHLRIFKALQGLYFGNNTAWLAQHGVAAGVAMIYVSYHIWRGEHRARILFLLLLFVEVIKYAVVTPNIGLLILYFMTFAILFALRSYFRRGSAHLTWRIRLVETAVMVTGVVVAVAALLILLLNNHITALITRETMDHFWDFVTSYDVVPYRLMRSSLLAHTFTSLIIGTLALLLWNLFRPNPHILNMPEADDEYRVRRLLQQYSTSSEDFFKLWPSDKQYFWGINKDAFIAYRVTKRVVYALSEPIGDPSDQDDLLETFISEWEYRGFIVSFIMVAESSLELYKGRGMKVLQIGSSAHINVDNFIESVVKNKWWRWQMNRARKAGYTYHNSMPPHDIKLLGGIGIVSEKWLTRPSHREQGFALGYYADEYMDKCVIDYLTNEQGEVIAFCNQVPVFNELACTTVDLMRFDPEYDNAMPYLLAELIKKLHEEKLYKSFDLGFVPLAKVDSILADIARLLSAFRFSSKGLEQFKNKFEPEWHANYIAFDGDAADLPVIALELEDAMKIKD